MNRGRKRLFRGQRLGPIALVSIIALGGCGETAEQAEQVWPICSGGVGWMVSCGGCGAAGATSSGGGAAAAGHGGNTGGFGGAESCPPPPACDAAAPDPGSAQPWNDWTTPILVTSQGAPQHRGRDLFLNPADPQWVLAKFAYGLADKDLKGENVDIHLLRDCGSSWEKLGTAITTEDSEHATVEGVEDTGGRIYFEIPGANKLALGRHRFHLVVQGDLTTTELFIEVVEPATPVFLSDIDGTLTTFETEEFVDLLFGNLPDANPHAAEVLSILVEKGFRPFYLTARPEWLGKRSRQFLEQRGFPPGIVHTTLSGLGALGDQAVTYKTNELQMLADKGIVPQYVFGNTDSDAEAYDNGGIMPLENRIFFQFDDLHGGRRIENYNELNGEFSALNLLCD